MQKISAVIITFNEEKNIGRCIKSVKDIVDEIVVVDSFSTDRTEEICNSFNVKFVKHEFEGHIEQKNWAITQASNHYVLSIDADEVLSDTLKRSIQHVKVNWKCDGYKFNRLTNYCGKWIKHTGWYPDVKLRLCDSRKGFWKGINPHDRYEMIEGSVVKHLKGDLLHYSYSSIKQHIDQVNKFTDIASNAAVKEGKSTNFIKIIFHPFWKFIRDYFIKLGFLDGYYGFVISMISAHATFLKHLKIRELRKNDRYFEFPE